MEHKVGSGRWFDWLMAVLGGALVAGIFLDGWAHLHLEAAFETFFTPWHAVMYSAYAICAVTLIIVWGMNIHRGFPWHVALPHHHGLSLVGVVVFALAGAGDLLWHQFIGIENNLEALLSPTHLGLALGAALIVGGPLRELLKRENQALRGLLADLPAVLSLAYFLSIISFMGQYLHPFANVWPAAETSDPFFGQALGIAQVVFFSVLLMSLVLTLLRRRDLPFGSFAVVLGLHAVAMAFLYDTHQFIITAVIAGLIIDMLVMHAGAQMHSLRVMRVFGFAVPTLFFILYFVAIEVTQGIVWSAHLWVGAIMIAGLIGWLMSFIATPSYHKHS